MPLLRKATLVITLLGALATLGLELHAAAPLKFDRSLVAGIGFLAWPLLPFGAVGFAVRLKFFRGLSVAVFFAASVALAAVSIFAYRPEVLRSSSTAALVTPKHDFRSTPANSPKRVMTSGPRHRIVCPLRSHPGPPTSELP